MSLDIGEIGVRVNVRDAQEDPQQKDKDRTDDACCADQAASRLTPSAQSDIVRQCVQQVLQALHREGVR